MPPTIPPIVLDETRIKYGYKFGYFCEAPFCTRIAVKIMPLTDVVVKKAAPRPVSYKLPDGRGLYLLVMPNGRKYWRMRYSWRGKENTPAFGVYPDVSLKTARMKRDEARLTLAQGVNPKTGRCFGTWWPGGWITWSDWLGCNLNWEVDRMISIDMARTDTIDVDPAEFFRMIPICV